MHERQIKVLAQKAPYLRGLHPIDDLLPMLAHTLGTFTLEASDLAAVLDVAESGWLSPGPKVKEFERQLAEVHGNRYGVMTNSGTDALRIALCALKERYGWKDGDWVIVPAITFVATINVVLQAGLTPVLADVGMYDFNINPDNILRRFITSGGPDPCLRAIIAVHLAGRPADMPRILEIAKEHDLKVIEDSCEAMGVPGIGLGDVTCFSFYMAHLLTTGVGGMAITNDESLNYLLWSYTNHGRREPKTFIFDRIGFSCRPTEFEAALGLAQLPRLPGQIEKRRKIFQHLYDRLDPIGDFFVQPPLQSACMFFPILLRDSSKLNKPEVLAALIENGIENRDLMPILNQPCYKDLNLVGEQNSFSVAEKVDARGFYIGCHQDLTPEILDSTIAVLARLANSQIL